MFPHSVNNVIIPQMLIFPAFEMQTLVDNNLILNMKHAPRFISGSVFLFGEPTGSSSLTCLQNHFPLSSFFLIPTPTILATYSGAEGRETEIYSTPHKCLICSTNLQMRAKATGEYNFPAPLRNYFFFSLPSHYNKEIDEMINWKKGKQQTDG